MIFDPVSECRVLLVGFTVPNDVIERICHTDRFMPVQKHKLAWSLVRGLEINFADVDLLSSEPVGTYPDNPQVFFRFRKWDRGNGSWNIMMPFINILGLKHITRFIASLFFIVCWIIGKRRERNRVILLPGMHSPFMYAALAIRLFSRVKVVTIITDPPGVQLPGEGSLIHLLRYVDTAIITKALQSMDGLITLTKQLAKQYAPLIPSIVVEAILYAEDYSSTNEISNTDEGRNDSCFNILYAGGLTVEYGVDLLLRAFSRIEDPSFRLWILGKGYLAPQIQAASKKDERIVFKGFCFQQEVKELLNKATVLVNVRSSNQQLTQFSFPSKTIEYMASGRPVISTRLPGIPEEYFSYIFPLENETPDGLSDLFIKLNAMPRKDLDEFGSKAKRFVFENKNESYQGHRILRFLTQVLSG